MDDVLRSFHRRRAGASHRVFGSGRLPDGRTSYERLADAMTERGRALDLACGDGALAEVLYARGHEVVGLDMSPEELALARERVPSATFVEGRAHDLPFESASFDGVLSHMALMLMGDVDRVVDEIARVLVPGGIAAVIVGSQGPKTPASELFFRELIESMKRDAIDARFGDPRARDLEGLRSLFAERFVDAEHEGLSLEVDVAADEAWSFFETSYYELDMLGDEQSRRLRAWTADHRDTLAPGGTMRWSFGMRLFRAIRSR